MSHIRFTGHARNLLLSAKDGEVDEVISSSSGWLAGSWLLLTEGVNNNTYDVSVVKEPNQGTGTPEKKSKQINGN